MLVYRISRPEFAQDLSGEGARLYGGRWNKKGMRMLYTSESASLALLEILAHFPSGKVLMPLSLITISIESDLIFEPEVSLLPADWQAFPCPAACQNFGSGFLEEGKFAVARLPSVLMPKDFNYLINPEHKGISAMEILKIETFFPDNRLIAQGA